jgi:hypothetical protein
MEVSETLKQAWAAVQEASLPQEIQAVAFREAVRLLTPSTSPSGIGRVGKPGQSGGGDGGAPSAGTGGGAVGQGGGITVSERELLEKVATQTGVELEKLDLLVHIDDGALKVSIPGIKLGQNNADKTRAIAQIFTVVRGFGLDEDGTSIELVRSETQRLKCYDSANFSSQLSKLQGYVIKGSGANRRIYAKAGGLKEFPGLVDSVLGRE